MLYQPLNKVQEEMYRRFRQEKAGLTDIGAEEMRKAGEIERESVAIPPIQAPTEKFSTVNLQQEIAKGMQQIIEATEKETVSDTMDNIKKIVEDIPFLQIEREKDESDSLKNVVSEVEIDGSLKIDFQEMLEEESDGQLSLLTNDRSNVERQITGQISIADVLEEWERTRRAAEAALQAADQRKLESAKARALHEAEDFMERLNDVIPKLDAGVTPKELLEEEYLQKNENELSVDELASEEGPVVSLDELVDEEEPVAVPDELVVEEEPIAGLDMLIEEEVFNEEIEEPVEEESSVLGMEESVVDDNSLADIEKSVDEEKTIDDDLLEAELDVAVEIDQNDIFNETGHSEEISSEEDKLEHEILENNITSTFKPVDIVTDLALAAQSEEGNGVGEQFNRVNSILGNQVSEISAKDPEIEEKLAFAATQKLPTIELLQELGAFDNTNDEAEEEVEELSEEQKAMFSYFIPVKGMEKQLSKVVSSISKHLMNKESASTGNLIVQGEQGCGKTMLATCIIKVLQNECDKPGKKIGKISAENINGKDLHQVVKKVAGGCLIIESAGKLDKKTMTSLSLVMERDNSGTLYILEDTSKGIKKLLSRDEIFASKFTEKVTVPMFTNDDLVAFARSYSRELGYEIDAMAVLALHNRISNIEKLDQATTITEVKEIVDEAIKDEAKIGLRKYFSILTAKRYTEDDKIVLTERNFEKY